MKTLDRFFDPQEVYESSVANRALVYLDTSVWATLADAREEAARRCVSACVSAVNDGRALFPVSYASISELFEHPSGSERHAQAALMDTLSLGVTFRASHKIYDVEAAAVMALVIGEEAGAFGKDLLFTYVIECLGDAQTTFPDLGSEKDVDVYAEHVRSHPAARSLSWWGQQEKMLVRIRAKHALSKANYVERMTASLEKNRSHFLNADGSLNRQRALREEYLWALKNEILPRLRKMLLVRSGPEGMLEVFRSFVRRNGEDGERRLVEFVGLMPSLKVFCEVMAARTMNPARAVRGQDFWDADHASIGCAHADAFATLDRGLLDLVENRCATPKRRGCRILHDIDEVTGYVDSLHRAADVSSVEVSEASGTQLHLGANQDG